MVAKNLLGQFYMNEIYITHVTGQFCQGIALMYEDSDQYLPNEYPGYHLLINKLYINVIGHGSKCYSFNEYFIAGVMIFVGGHVKETKIIISNSFFNRLHSTAMYIRSKCESSRNITLENCTFDSIIAINEPVIYVGLFENNNFISFNNCTFKRNYAEGYSLVSLKIEMLSDISCEFSFNQKNLLTPSNVHFRENQFISNYGKILNLYYTNKGLRTLYIMGPISIIHNVAHMHAHHNSDLISIENMIVHIDGPLIISHNNVKKFSI